MFGWYYCWRLKRRQHALALAWCGDPEMAAWLVRESSASAPCLKRLDVYRRMADTWLRYLETAGSQAPSGRHASLPAHPSTSDPAVASVRSLIGQMPMAQRMTLSLIDIARLSYRDTAAVMNIGMFEVQYHIVTARRELLEQLHVADGERVGAAARSALEIC